MTKGFYKLTKTSNIFTISSTHFWKEATESKKITPSVGLLVFNYWCSNVWNKLDAKQIKGKRVSIWKSFSSLWRKSRLVVTPMFWVSQIITMEIKFKCWPESSITGITLSSSGKAILFRKQWRSINILLQNFRHRNLSARTASKLTLIVLVLSHFCL